MSARIHFGTVVVVGSLLFLAGCGTPSPRTSTPPARRGAAAAAPGPASIDYSPGAVEKRTEAHARYAAAVLHDLNDRPEQAIEEFYKAALADPSNEALVLEVSTRLLRFKENDKAVELLSKACAEPGASGALFARLGLVYSLLDKKDKAIEANRIAIKRAPRLLAGYQNLARIYFQSAQNDEAFKILEQAAKQPDVDAVFLVELGGTFTSVMRGSRADAAKSHARDSFDRAAKLKPSNPLLLQQMADGYVVIGEAEKAAELYRKLLERFPGLPGLREKLAETYIRQEDRKNAAEQLEQLIRANPTDPKPYYDLGDIAIADKKWEDARDYLTKALALIPEFQPVYYKLSMVQLNLDQPKEALITLNRARARFSQSFAGEYFTAKAYLRLKDFSNAANHMVAAEVVARATQTNFLNHEFYFELGAIYERNLQFEDAERSFRKSVQMSPSFTNGYFELAALHINANKPNEALSVLTEIRSKFSDTFFGEYLAAKAYLRMKNYSNAVNRLLAAETIARKSDPSALDHQFYFELGAAYERNQQYRDAEKFFRQSLKLSPDFSEALNYLGYMWAERGTNLREAREMIEKAVKMEPDNAAFLDSLGWVLFKLNQPAEALPYLLKAIENSKEADATLYDHLGDVYAALNETDKAHHAWRRSLDVEPNAQIQKKLGPAPLSHTDQRAP